jgi:1-deoxy-D-xylulose-5-phosphate synthase
MVNRQASLKIEEISPQELWVAGELDRTTADRFDEAHGRVLALMQEAREDESIVAITAAMPSGTGTSVFQEKYPERFFDVGIAEGHAVTFAAGLATQGIRPVCAIYSTFLQRAYDNLIHDVAVQHLPVIFCLDRAGLVGEDGQTHMGLYDIAYMLAIPGMTVTAPKDGEELIGLLRTALAQDGPFSTRYPRDKAPAEPRPVSEIPPVPYGTWEQLRPGKDVAILAVGTMVLPARSTSWDSLDNCLRDTRSLRRRRSSWLKRLACRYSGMWALISHSSPPSGEA